MPDSDSLSTGTETTLEQWWDQYGSKRERAGEHRVEIFVRSLSTPPGGHDRRRRVLEMFRSVSDEDATTDFELTVLGKEVCTCKQCRQICPDETLLETVTELIQWRSGGIQSCGFVERSVQSSVTGEKYRVIVPPELALGIYVDDALVGVFPCLADGVAYGPEVFIEGLLSDYEVSSEDREKSVLPPADS